MIFTQKDPWLASMMQSSAAKMNGLAEKLFSKTISLRQLADAHEVVRDDHGHHLSNDLLAPYIKDGKDPEQIIQFPSEQSTSSSIMKVRNQYISISY